ncbi:MAG: sugar phosphate isomerase/epimerase [Spirochaetaceae bacterium]|nr:sugar phosphate isomerase/epimerase [Spirochaetaceae bacterium]
MKICIRPHDVGKATAQELGEKIHELGFDGVQLAIAKAIAGQNGSPETLTDAVIQEIRSGFNNNEVDIALLGAYFNPVHSNKQKVFDGQQKIMDHLKKAAKFGTKYVATESGSYNDDKWTYNPKNQTEEAFQEVKSVFIPVAQAAKEANAVFLIEGAWHHCMFKPQQLKRMVDELDNGHVCVTVDILNYLYIGNYQNREAIFQECLELFKDKIKVFHIKDFVIENDQIVEVEIGKGIMGWHKFLPIIKEKYPEAILVFEGVKNVPASLQFVKKVLYD